jgi:hypothetical protein
VTFNPVTVAANFAENHPYWTIFIAIIFPNAVSTMPTPNGVGIRGSTAYKWVFGFLHALPNIPRLIAVLFPSLAQYVGLVTPAQAATNAANLTDGKQ